MTLQKHIGIENMINSSVNEVRLHQRDTGSADVQIVILTQKVLDLREKYINSGRSDRRCRRDMIMFLNRRQCLLDYLKVTDTSRYQNIIEVLGIHWM